jgi:hypothetical protein
MSQAQYPFRSRICTTTWMPDKVPPRLLPSSFNIFDSNGALAFPKTLPENPEYSQFDFLYMYQNLFSASNQLISDSTPNPHRARRWQGRDDWD